MPVHLPVRAVTGYGLALSLVPEIVAGTTLWGGPHIPLPPGVGGSAPAYTHFPLGEWWHGAFVSWLVTGPAILSLATCHRDPVAGPPHTLIIPRGNGGMVYCHWCPATGGRWQGPRIHSWLRVRLPYVVLSSHRRQPPTGCRCHAATVRPSSRRQRAPTGGRCHTADVVPSYQPPTGGRCQTADITPSYHRWQPYVVGKLPPVVGAIQPT